MSKELEALEEIRDFRYGKDKLLVCQTEMYNTIKQALIKAQEHEKENIKYKQLEEELGCPLVVRERALNGFYIEGYGYVSNNDDFIYLRKDDNGYYLKVVIHPSKPTPPNFLRYYDIHYLKDYKKTWWLKEDRSE